MADIALSNVINVSITGIPRGLTERNVNNLAYFTTDVPNNVDIYRDYFTAREVAADFGTDSIVYDMANSIFAQTPNILTGNGVLRIIPLMNAVDATRGKFRTIDITNNIANILAVTNGYMRVTIDGVNYDLTGLNFSSCSTLRECLSIIQNRLQNCIVGFEGETSWEINLQEELLSYDDDGDIMDLSENVVIFESKTYGSTSIVSLSSVPGATGTSLIGASYFNAAGGTAQNGTNSSGESIEEAIVRTEQLIPYTGIISDLKMEDAIIDDLSDTVQSRDMIIILDFSSTAQLTGIVKDITDSTNTHTRCLFYSDPNESAYMKSAYAGRAFSVNFNGSATSQTMNLKALATIIPDSNVNQTIYNSCATVGADMYISYSGVPSVVSNGANLFFDQIYSRLALKFALEAGMFNYLRQTNTKVPQTEYGMTGLKNSAIIQLNRFVVNGYIGVGLIWNSSETFGNPVVFKENITTNGYYVYSIPIANQIQSERELRESPLVQIAVKEAGAIHSADVIVVIEA